uniref:Cytochrome P450 4C1 n=1 Tax=Lygus hesperus TaxID=30085 RepID=A0A0K8SC59_LYGHE
MIIEIGLIAIGLLVIWWAIQPDALALKYGSRIPGPNSYPIVGNLLNIPLTGAEALKAQGEMFKTHGGLIRLWMGNQLVVCMANPDDVEVLLKSNTLIQKTKFYNFLNSWLGFGLIISGGDKWRARRKAITPTFHFKILENFIDVFNRNGNILIDRLSSKVNQGTFDVLPYITAYTLDVICETAMGTRIDAQSGNNKDYQDAVRRISTLLGKRFNTPVLHNNLAWFLSGMKSKENELVKILKHHTYQVIKSKADGTQKLESSVSEHEEDGLGIKKKTAFLELLLEMKKSLNPAFQTDEDVQEEVDTFMFEGHDTTTSGICFALDLLALNPDCQEKLYEELNARFEKSNCNPTMDDLNNLKYLDMVVKESLRLCPSVPSVARQITENLDVPSGYTIPKGTFAVINFYQIHRNEKYFPNPEVFNPDNFLPEVVANRHPFAYVPFSAGPRNCIGQKFALFELKSTLAKLVTHFKVECDPGYQLSVDSNLVLQARDGHMIKLSRRA